MGESPPGASLVEIMGAGSSSENGAPIFTDYYIEPEEILRGETEEKQITIRTRGGLYKGVREIHEPAAALVPGETYVLMLVKPEIGGGFNLPGDDYYYVNYGCQGAFQTDPRQRSANLSLTQQNVIPAESQLKGAVIVGGDPTTTMDELHEELDIINETSPVEEIDQWQEFMETQETNLKNGITTEEGYQRDIENAQKYATKIE